MCFFTCEEPIKKRITSLTHYTKRRMKINSFGNLFLDSHSTFYICKPSQLERKATTQLKIEPKSKQLTRLLLFLSFLFLGNLQ